MPSRTRDRQSFPDLTSWPSLQTDIRNAGGTGQDDEVITSPDNGWTLVTSRNPGDLPAFSKTAVSVFAGEPS